MLRLETLGPPRILPDDPDRGPELRWRKNLALLVYLARSPRRSRTRDHLTGLLWPDKPEKDARHSLREAMRIVRRAVGEEGLRTDGDAVVLAETAVQLDADELVAAGDREDWCGAAGLVRGEFLEGFQVSDASGFEDWLAAERLAWRERSVGVLARCAEVRLREGAVDDGRAYAERAHRLDPAAEDAARALMRSLALLGRPAAALDCHARLEEALGERGAVAGTETAALAARIREGHVRQAVERPAADQRRPPLVRRESVLARLLAVWDDVRAAPRAAAVLVAADPGFGKSRVLEEVAQRARLDGAVTAVVRAVPADTEAPWSGVFGLAGGGLADAPGVGGVPASELSTFAARLPAWAERFPPARTLPPGDPGAAFRQVLSAVTEETPVALFVDDAEWLDPASQLALEAALRDLPARPLLVFLTLSAASAPAPLERLRAAVGRDVPGLGVTLDGLDAGGLAALARWALPDFGAAEIDRVTRRLAIDSAGVPLLVVELLHAIAAGLALNDDAAAWPRPFRTLDQTLPGELPDNVVAAIRIGFRRLSREAQDVCAAASVLGDRVDAGTLERATGHSAVVLLRALDELEWARWLSAEPRGYAFVARIVRDVVARDMLTAGQRQRLAAARG